MSATQAADTRKIVMTTTDTKENFVSLCDGLLICSDADCYIDFDQPTDTGSQLVKANQSTMYWPIQFTEIHARTVSGGGNLYITGLRGSRR